MRENLCDGVRFLISFPVNTSKFFSAFPERSNVRFTFCEIGGMHYRAATLLKNFIKDYSPCAYQEVRNIGFPENFAYILNE